MKKTAKTPAITKTCIKCGKFGENRLFLKGGRGMCNRCTKLEWENNNPIKLRAQRLYGNCTKRAKKFGWEKPDFDSNWIYEKIKNGYCEVTGIEFDLDNSNTNTHSKNPFVPSVDRIDSSRPYLKSNVKLVVYMYNVCKSEFSHKDVLNFCQLVNKNENKI
jgi:hypothetical protein